MHPAAEHNVVNPKLNKETIAKDIGCFYGTYFEENNQFCIDNYEKVFRYDSVDALLKDWLDTIIISHHDEHHFDEEGREWDSWEKEILFIYENVIGKYPEGICCIPESRGANWTSCMTVSVPVNGSERKMDLDLGSYLSIVDAIYAQEEFQEIYAKSKTKDIKEAVGIADQIREKSKAIKKLSFSDDIGYTEFEVSSAWYNKRSDIDAATLFHMASADDSSCLNDLTGKYYEEKLPLSDQIQAASARTSNDHSYDFSPAHDQQH